MIYIKLSVSFQYLGVNDPLGFDTLHTTAALNRRYRYLLRRYDAHSITKDR